METIVTIKGHRVIDIYESFDGSYWFVTEKAWKQDSVINGTVHENDQILFGYARLSACPQFAEFGYFSEAELKSLGNRIWKVPQKNWAVCPEVEVRPTHERRGNHGALGGREGRGDASVWAERFLRCVPAQAFGGMAAFWAGGPAASEGNANPARLTAVPLFGFFVIVFHGGQKKGLHFLLMRNTQRRRR